MTSTISLPPAKRVKLEDTEDTNAEPNQSSADVDEIVDGESEADEDNENNCSICLQSIVDRTVVPTCSHEFCFECLLVWTEQSRRCPLCSQNIGQYLIHSIRSRYDYRKHFLPPLRTSPLPSRPASSNSLIRATRQNARRRRREREWGVRENESEEFDKLERSIAKRRWIYQHDLYAKHVASNAYTKYRPYPTPAQFAASPDLISRTTSFLRRELQVWEGLDVEFLTTLILSLMKAIDIRSESAVKLISEFLDMDEPYTPGGRHVNAEHFAHEVYCYVRSPYKDLFVYDSVVQYDTPSGITPPPDVERSRRWRPPRPTDAPGESSSPPAESSRRQRSLSRHLDEYVPVNSSRELHIFSRGQTAREEPEGLKSELSDKASHRSHRRSKDHPTQDEGYQRRLTAINNHEKYISDKDLAIDSGEHDGKGKRKANEAETELHTRSAQSAVSEDIRTIIDSGKSESDLTRPVESPPRKDTRPSQGVLPSGGPSGPKAQKPPRHRSLLESVQAHLAGNGGAKAAPKELRKEENFQGQASHIRTSREDRIDRLPDSNGVERIPLPGNSKGKAREQPISDALQESSSFREDGLVRMGATCLPPAATGVDELSATPSPLSRTPTLPQMKSRTTLESHDTAINTRNSTSHGISYNAINDVRAAPSSSGVNGLQGERYAASLRPAKQNAVVTGTGSRNSIRSSLRHEQVSDSAPRARADSLGTAMHGTQIGTSNVEDRSPTSLVPEFPGSPLGEGSLSKATSITFANQPLPHATSVKSDAEAMRAKLLARLALEKKHAQASVRADISVDSNAQKKARDLQRNSRLPDSLLPPEDVSRARSGISDGKSASDSFPGLIAQGYGEGTDPDFASGIVAEEARTQEANLRRRAQLRVRLAAERRLADGS